jgi:hypothetical protein
MSGQSSKKTAKRESVTLRELREFMEENFVLALRYLYYVERESVISDKMYDKLEKKVLATAPKNSLLRKPGSDRAIDYPAPARYMASYIFAEYLRVFARRRGEYYPTGSPRPFDGKKFQKKPKNLQR